MHPEKYTSPPIMTAESLLNYRWPDKKRPAPPQSILMLMDQYLVSIAKGQIRARSVGSPLFQAFIPGFLRSGPGVTQVFGVGGATVVAQAELLAAWGVKKLVLLCQAGSLDQTMRAGHIVIPTQALRHDGVSDHYLPPKVWAWPHEALSDDIANTFKNYNFIIHREAVWTTSAPFRETAAEIWQYGQDGIKAVDMESASLFAAAEILGIEVATVLVISDFLTPKKHRLASEPELVTRSLRKAVGRLIQIL